MFWIVTSMFLIVIYHCFRNVFFSPFLFKIYNFQSMLLNWDCNLGCAISKWWCNGNGIYYHSNNLFYWQTSQCLEFGILCNCCKLGIVLVKLWVVTKGLRVYREALGSECSAWRPSNYITDSDNSSRAGAGSIDVCYCNCGCPFRQFSLSYLHGDAMKADCKENKGKFN